MQSELTGGIKNALEKGENMQKVKQSFLNAGYSQREVNAAVAALNTQITKTPSITQPLTTNKLPSPTNTKPKNKFPWWLIIVIILCIIILIGAAILGFNWDNIFNLISALI